MGRGRRAFRIRYQIPSEDDVEGPSFADFLTEMTPAAQSRPTELLWTIHVNDSSNSKGIGAELIVENQVGLIIEFSLTFSFTTSNN